MAKIVNRMNQKRMRQDCGSTASARTRRQAHIKKRASKRTINRFIKACSQELYGYIGLIGALEFVRRARNSKCKTAVLRKMVQVGAEVASARKDIMLLETFGEKDNPRKLS